ncbi:hypothetical protein [Arthrobacter bambusae]|uniref:Uncharacterized protein n=1 Tax=Arthrobacter bambusae TaxID=1338426 RepID=A0AAW8D9X5_9MICC|nr:hypothetical protein [Arthrobacter bambusae]MDP9903283.1 hypothetical protein [Arthrobacter bambusae]MDQ0128723.1 hypothetical protein [Arthrobacter bambusae]MDQ0180064.1 hypothetical protein [Arthrobacter bambusae]
MRIEKAGEYVELYRSRMAAMQEGFWELAARHGVVDDPGFRGVLDRVAADVDENLRGAAVVIARLEDEDRELTVRQAEELDTFARERRMRSGTSDQQLGAAGTVQREGGL